MTFDFDDLELPRQDFRGSGPRMQLTGAQYVRWWTNNLEKLAATGHLERMLEILTGTGAVAVQRETPKL